MTTAVPPQLPVVEESPTAHIRLVRRGYDPGAAGLQQKWERRVYKDGACVTIDYEWRDVPLVLENDAPP